MHTIYGFTQLDKTTSKGCDKAGRGKENVKRNIKVWYHAVNGNLCKKGKSLSPMSEKLSSGMLNNQYNPKYSNWKPMLLRENETEIKSLNKYSFYVL